MIKKPLASQTSMNSSNAVNPNRMTFLMSISEITPQLYLAGQMAATIEQVQKLGITYIVNVAIESSIIPYPKTIKMEKFDIIDFPTAPISNYFHTLTDKIHAHITANKQNKVLVHCMAGISRSTTIVCAYLMRYMNMTLRDAYLLCKKARPICFPNLGFWNQLIAYEIQLKKENSVKMIPTQFGHIPDVAFEEIKQLRIPQPQLAQPGSMAFSNAAVFSPPAPTVPPPAPVVNTSATVESSNIASRSTGRDLPIGHAGTLVRSRSLASNSTSRPAVAPVSLNSNHSSFQTLFPSNRPAYLAPTRFGINRLGAGPPAAGQTNSSNPLGGSTLNGKARASNPPAVVSVDTDEQRAHYETTYRSSFIKPLAP